MGKFYNKTFSILGSILLFCIFSIVMLGEGLNLSSNSGFLNPATAAPSVAAMVINRIVGTGSSEAYETAGRENPDEGSGSADSGSVFFSLSNASLAGAEKWLMLLMLGLFLSASVILITLKNKVWAPGGAPLFKRDLLMFFRKVNALIIDKLRRFLSMVYDSVPFSYLPAGFADTSVSAVPDPRFVSGRARAFHLV